MKLYDSVRPKEGDVIFIYKNWENESELLGTARLRKLKSTGRSFILEEMLPESSQIVYNYDEWLVDWDLVPYDMVHTFPHLYERPQKVRYIDTIGLSNSKED